MKYKYKVGDEITVITKKEHKAQFFNQKGIIKHLYYTDDLNPYDIDFYNNSLNGKYSFGEDEICLQGEENRINIKTSKNNNVKLSKKEKEVYKIANNVLYLNDNSDCQTALYEILKVLKPDLEDYPELKYIE